MWSLAPQVYMCSCGPRKSVFLLHKITRLLASQEDVSSCSTKNTCPLALQENMSSCSTRREVFLLHKKTRLLVPQEDMSPCSTRRDVFLWNEKTCLPIEQEDMSSCGTGKMHIRKNHQISPIRLQMRAPDASMPAFDAKSQSGPKKDTPRAWWPNFRKIRFEEVGGRGGSL